MRQKNRVINFIANTVITILLSVVMLILVVLIVICIKTNNKTMEIAGFMGYKPVICISNSMQQEFEVGDIIISKEVSENSIKTGDIITYREDETIITHRVCDIVKENNQIKYITKGDSNNTIDDNLVDYNQIEGMYCYKIPKLGSLILTLKKPQVLVLIALLPICIIAIIYKTIINRKEIKELRKRKLLKRLQEKQIAKSDI